MSKLSDAEKDSYYISPKDFAAKLRAYYDASEEVEAFQGDKESKEYRHLLRRQKRALDVCGVCLYRMVVGLSNNGKFSGYTTNWKSDMVGDAMMQATRALVGRKYDFSKGYNPFSYFNMICWREFVNRIKIEKKKVEMEDKFIEEHRSDFAEQCDTPIYVRPSLNSQLKEFWDVEVEVNYNNDSVVG